MSRIHDEKYVQNICKVGQGAACCAYLGMDKHSFKCLKDSLFEKVSIDARKNEKEWLSKGDNCDGYEKEEEKKYYLSLEPVEYIIREFLALLKESGFFYRADFDPYTIELNKIISPPKSGHGFRITSFEDNKGQRLACDKRIILGSAPKRNESDEIHIGVNTIQSLAGGTYTFILKPVNGKLKITERKTHSRS